MAERSPFDFLLLRSAELAACMALLVWCFIFGPACCVFCALLTLLLRPARLAGAHVGTSSANFKLQENAHTHNSIRAKKNVKQVKLP